MESALSAEAPELAASFDAWRVKPPGTRRWPPVAATWLAVALMLGGLVLASVVMFWLGALAAGALLGVGHWRRRTERRRPPTS
jgi:hypothetical protein